MKQYIQHKLLLLLAVILASLCLSGTPSASAVGTYDDCIILLHTNDVHGAVSTADSDGKARLGIASVAEMKKDFENMGAYVLLLDAGDFAQGSELVAASEGVFAVELMNEAGYDAACIGEAELDYGYAGLQTLAGRADFPLLGANVTEPDTPCLQASVIFTAPDGTKIGVFGLVTPAVHKLLHPSRTEGLTVASDAEGAMIVCAEEQVAKLNEAGCSLIVCVGHLGTGEAEEGNRSLDILEQVEGIDLFIDGHSHDSITDDDDRHRVGDAMLVSSGTELEQIGAVVWDGSTLESRLYSIADYSGVDEKVAKRVTEKEELLAERLTEHIANAEISLGIDNAWESPLGCLMTDAMLKRANQIDKVDAAVLAGGSLQTALPAGTLTRGDLRTALAGQEQLQLLQVTGAQLLTALEAATAAAPADSPDFPQVCGIRYTVDTNIAYDASASGSRVQIASIHGNAFDPEAVYLLAVSDALTEREAYASLRNATLRYDLHIPLEDLLADYIASELDGSIDADLAEPQKRVTVIIIPFTDVLTESWYFDAVQYVYRHEMMNGVDETRFAPDLAMTRGMMVTMLYRLSGSPAVENPASETFPDIADGEWYADAVAWAVEAGITNGMGDGTFQPNTVLNRQQMATFFYRHAVEYRDAEPVEGYELSYADADKIEPWAREAVVWCTANGLMQGMGNNEFQPYTAASRAMGAALLMRYRELAAA